mmetsp:Transcript_5070/g.14055  ORF Transcript_5070/g.14055 Transcript_5070/m.14055 type:complete len:859 (-) Transcript_5070:283-2859(-)
MSGQDAAPVTSTAPGAKEMVLTIVRGGRGGQIFTLRAGGALRIGREAGMDIRLGFQGISMLHTELLLSPGGAFLCVIDHSKNGTGVRPGPEAKNSGWVGDAHPNWERLKPKTSRMLEDGWQLIVPVRSRKGEEQLPESQRTFTIFMGNRADKLIASRPQPAIVPAPAEAAGDKPAAVEAATSGPEVNPEIATGAVGVTPVDKVQADTAPVEKTLAKETVAPEGVQIAQSSASAALSGATSDVQAIVRQNLAIAEELQATSAVHLDADTLQRAAPRQSGAAPEGSSDRVVAVDKEKEKAKDKDKEKKKKQKDKEKDKKKDKEKKKDSDNKKDKKAKKHAERAAASQDIIVSGSVPTAPETRPTEVTATPAPLAVVVDSAPQKAREQTPGDTVMRVSSDDLDLADEAGEGDENTEKNGESLERMRLVVENLKRENGLWQQQAQAVREATDSEPVGRKRTQEADRKPDEHKRRRRSDEEQAVGGEGEVADVEARSKKEARMRAREERKAGGKEDHKRRKERGPRRDAQGSDVEDASARKVVAESAAGERLREELDASLQLARTARPKKRGKKPDEADEDVGTGSFPPPLPQSSSRPAGLRDGSVSVGSPEDIALLSDGDARPDSPAGDADYSVDGPPGPEVVDEVATEAATDEEETGQRQAPAPVAASRLTAAAVAAASGSAARNGDDDLLLERDELRSISPISTPGVVVKKKRKSKGGPQESPPPGNPRGRKRRRDVPDDQGAKPKKDEQNRLVPSARVQTSPSRWAPRLPRTSQSPPTERIRLVPTLRSSRPPSSGDEAAADDAAKDERRQVPQVRSSPERWRPQRSPNGRSGAARGARRGAAKEVGLRSRGRSRKKGT